MRPLIRSLFLLCFAAAPIAAAATPATEAVSPAGTVSAAASDAVFVEPSTKDTALIGPEVQELATTIDGLRRALAQLLEQEEVRSRIIGDPNDHLLWP